MNDFNPDAVNAAAAKIKELSGIDIRPVRNIHQEEVERRAKEKLKDVAFICEAFSEMDDSAIRDVGATILGEMNNPNLRYACIGFHVYHGLKAYAMKCAEQDMKWAGFDAQRQFEQELRDNEDAARADERRAA